MGKPDKSNYRKYKIKTVVGQDDFASMKEVIYRRYSKIEVFPDLILVDGGLGQLNAAREVLEHLQINIPLISIAKREELIYGTHLDNFGPIAISHTKESLKLLQRIRDEAHRFVITYQKLLRQKDLFD
jgi:excinuclease ABC subunit C